MQNNLLQVVTRVTPKVRTSIKPISQLPINYERFSETKLPMWYDIKFISYPGVMPYRYLINSIGKVFDTFYGIEKIPYANNVGYYTISIQNDSDMCEHYELHRLVAYEFCNPPACFMDLIVNHIDGNKHNDYCNNLEWVTMTANNQHARKMYDSIDRYDDGRPDNVQTDTIHKICKLFEEGKTNTEVMSIFGWEQSNRNHTFLRDIRNRSTWSDISYKYKFEKSSKKHAYTKEEKEQIRKYVLQGKTNSDIFYIMNKTPYVAALHRRDSKYRTIQSINESIRRRMPNE